MLKNNFSAFYGHASSHEKFLLHFEPQMIFFLKSSDEFLLPKSFFLGNIKDVLMASHTNKFVTLAKAMVQ